LHTSLLHLAGHTFSIEDLLFVLVEGLILASLHVLARVTLGKSVSSTKFLVAEFAVPDDKNGFLGAVPKGTLVLLPAITTSESEYQVEGGLLLDVVVGEGTAILELLSGEDEALLVWWDSLLVLDLGLDVVNGIGRLNLKGDGLSGEGLDEDLHSSAKSQDQMESGLLLDVVVSKGTTVLELLSSEDKALLIWWDSLLVLDLGLDIVDRVRRLDFESNGLSGEGLDENLHSSAKSQDQMEG